MRVARVARASAREDHERGSWSPLAPSRRRMQDAGAAAYAQLPAFCRVAATLTPAPDSDIEMEIWLPAENWNGKFLAVGNGGWAGTISLDAVATGLRRGYAAASNDTGHSDAGAAVRAQPGQVDRLRVSRDARDDRAVEDDRRRVLQPSARGSRTTRAARLADGRG